MLTKILKTKLLPKSSPHYYQYPFIDRACFKSAMDNYRLAVDTYNTSIEVLNKDVVLYNAKVKAMLKARPITTTQEELVFSFKTTHKRLFVKDYNKAVEAFNTEHGPLVTKEKHQPIRFQTELIFSVLLGFYASQLKQRNLECLQNNKPTACVLPHLKLNSYQVAQHKVEGIKRLGISRRTVQRHIKKLRAANILVGYQYRGAKLPVNIYISSEILQVKDAKDLEGETTDNSFFNTKQTTECRKLIDTTRPLKRNIKEKAVENSTETNGFNSIAQLKDWVFENENTTEEKLLKVKDKTVAATSYLLSQRQEDYYTLAADLKNGRYYVYEPISLEALYNETYLGVLTKTQFRQVLIQEFLKQSAKLWTGKSPYLGSWLKTIELFNQNYLQNSYQIAYDKPTQLKQFLKWNWMLNKAYSWQKRGDRYTLYPHEFFDYTRLDMRDGGFWHWSNKYEQYKAKQKQDKQVLESKAKRRKTDYQKAKLAVKKYLSGIYDLPALERYISSTIPKYLPRLAKLIDKQLLNSLQRDELAL